ncbi:KUP/HAK/KT family potassium transporter [Candidatus Peregrinibacteria bacterium]|nr:KUP/HAK/KT family potassium transporter [Candidatus Peregrinibacteria bacterium]
MNHGKPHSKFWLLCLGALGVVYGDIGTSPLYAINKIFFGSGEIKLTPENIYGGISLVIWAIILVVSLKYLLFVLRADNDGEGGVFALYGLINRFKKSGAKWLMIMLIFASGLLFGDGVITPAISVLSAVEGLSIATPFFEPYIIFITILVLTGLFAIQHKGTAKVGNIFGPIIMIWFFVIAAFGLQQILLHPQILNAFNPLYGILFLQKIGWLESLVILGAVMLVITGGEALYADMGHFGRRPIRLSWFYFVFPALILNYLGQGAYLLNGSHVANGNIFYSMIPAAALYPMVVLATAATVIASQALISGAFSLTAQAIALGLFPRMKILHTHATHAGQIYLPFINWTLYAGCIILVFAFRSSGNLASAYGLAVSGVMFATSLAMMVLARFAWKWSVFKTAVIFGSFVLIDGIFLGANTLKILEGGFVPIAIGSGLFFIMMTWRWGRRIIHKEYVQEKTMTVAQLIEYKAKAEHFIDRSIVIMAHKMVKRPRDTIPALTQFFTDRYGLLPKNLIFLNIITKKVSHVRHDRCDIRVFQREPGRGSIVSVTMQFGFMENPNVERVLEGLAAHHRVNLPSDPENWLVHVSSEKLVPGKKLGFFKNLQLNLFLILRRNSLPAYHYYGLGKEVNLSMEIMPIRVG